MAKTDYHDPKVPTEVKIGGTDSKTEEGLEHGKNETRSMMHPNFKDEMDKEDRKK
jgi:hypothetical protein